MTYQESVRSVLSNYATFSGRASVSEFWWFYLFTLLISMAFSVLGLIFHDSNGEPALWIIILQGLFGLAILLPSIAVAVRRMHDIGKEGGWIFINLVPLIGWIWFIVLAATPGQLGDNRFGPMPR